MRRDGKSRPVTAAISEKKNNPRGNRRTQEDQKKIGQVALGKGELGKKERDSGETRQ